MTRRMDRIYKWHGLFAFALLIVATPCNMLIAQALVNNQGAVVAMQPGLVAIVKTNSVDNASGYWSNGGRLIVEQDFINNDTATGGGTTGKYEIQGNWVNNADFIADSSTVQLYGASQQITGTSITEFHNLDLVGTGVKSQTIDARTNSILSLNDRELDTDVNTMFVLNTDPAAITRTTGFVSSLGAGRLSRRTDNTAPYLYPLGSSAGTPRYRPLEMTPASNMANTYAARLANVDATTEGYDRNNTAPGICQVNGLFYHQIEHSAGTTAVALKFYYNPNTDGNWTKVAHWQNVPQWENTSTTVTGSVPPFTTLEISNWTNFTLPAFALANEAPDYTAALMDPNCFGESTGAIDITVNNATPPYNFSWDNGSMTEDITSLTAGDYTLIFSDAGGCSDTATYTLTDPAEIDINGTVTDLLCYADNDGAIDIALSNAVQPVSYNWSNNATSEDISGLAAGTYTLTVTDANNCEKTYQAMVDSPPELIVNGDVSDISCSGFEDGSISISVSGGEPGYSYQWTHNNATGTSIDDLSSGTYGVVVYDANECLVNTSFTIGEPDPIEVDAGEDQTIVKGYSTSLEASALVGGTGLIEYEWLPASTLSTPNGSVTTATPEETTDYVVMAVDENGCAAFDTVTVLLDQRLYDFPDGFTPNGDGRNDVFEIVTSATVTVTDLKIFNRWGELVHGGTTNKWDGYRDGKLQPMDTYLFQAEIELPDGEEVVERGNFVLIW